MTHLRLFFFKSLMLFFLVINITYFSHRINFYYSYIFYPFLIIYHRIIDPIYLYMKRNHENNLLHEEILQLKKEKNQLIEQLIDSKSNAFYYEQIQELILFKKRFSSGKIAQILSRHLSDQAHFIYIDKGSNHGIEPDMIAITYNRLIGKITTVYPWYSKVCLITDKECKVSIFGAESKIKGIHQGLNNEQVTKIKFVDNLQKVCLHEEIFSSGEGFVFPQGFALGKVIKIEKGVLYQEIDVEPLFFIQDITYCTVLSKKDL